MGCHRSGNSKGKKFLKVREKSVNGMSSQRKSIFRRKVWEDGNNLTRLI